MQPDDDQPEVVLDSSYQDELAEKQSSLVHSPNPFTKCHHPPKKHRLLLLCLVREGGVISPTG